MIAARLAPVLSSRLRSGVVGATVGARWRLSFDSLPKATRHVHAGYWISAEPEREHLEEMWARGIRVIISASPLVGSMRAAIAEIGFHHVYMPFGSRFPRPRRLLEVSGKFRPDQIFIHCAHGADRSGAVLAYLLAVREHWPIARALLAVALPEPGNVRALVQGMRRAGIEVEDQDIAQYTGVYSAERNGHFGGLKAYGESYQRLLRTTLTAVEKSTRVLLSDASHALD